jgi:putative membrane protein
VDIFDAANTWDVETGALALERSRDPEVRAFAEMMVRDHKAVRQLGRDLAAKLAVPPPPPGPPCARGQEARAAMRKLRAARGQAFETAYVAHEVAYHQAVIDAVTTQLLPATRNAELRALEVKVAPNFQAHLAAAKSLQQKLASKK